MLVTTIAAASMACGGGGTSSPDRPVGTTEQAATAKPPEHESGAGEPVEKATYSSGELHITVTGGINVETDLVATTGTYGDGIFLSYSDSPDPPLMTVDIAVSRDFRSGTTEWLGDVMVTLYLTDAQGETFVFPNSTDGACTVTLSESGPERIAGDWSCDASTDSTGNVTVDAYGTFSSSD